MFDRKFRPMSQYQYRIENNIHGRSTEMSIFGTDILIKVYISNDFHARNRRHFLLSLYHKILPFLDFAHESKIHHNHHIDDYTGIEKIERLSLKQGVCIKKEKHKIGYLIRGIRTRLGKTQVEFAKFLNIEPTYLSKIEKGHRIASRKIVKKMAEMKNAPEFKNPEAFMKKPKVKLLNF